MSFWKKKEPIEVPVRRIDILIQAKKMCQIAPPKERERKSQPEKPPIGWRVWHVHDTEDGWLLRSVVSRFWWRGPVERNANPIDSTAEERWGFYSLKDRTNGQLGGYLETAKPRIENRQLDGMVWVEVYPAIGQIECLGHVIEAEDGYRSQGALIKELYVGVNHPSMIAALADRYQCDVKCDPKMMPAEIMHDYSAPGLLGALGAAHNNIGNAFAQAQMQGMFGGLTSWGP